MEKSVLHKKFNEVGAMLLCEHTRKLVDALSTLVSGSVRNDFAHLNQIAFLLNAGSVQEAASLLLSCSQSSIHSTQQLRLHLELVCISCS